MTETIYVIGAGASSEAQLPTGNLLKKEISEILNIKFNSFGREMRSGDYIVFDALRKYAKDTGGDINSYLHRCWEISAGLSTAISIDNYLDNRRGNDEIALCGKLGIVRAILKSERNSLLYDKPSSMQMNFSHVENTWYESFFQLLTENCNKKDLEIRFKKITLIVFNYDRCVERYIYFALMNTYSIKPEEASELMGFITIYHPYGKISGSSQDQDIEFGGEPSPNQLLSLAASIKTFTESTDPRQSDIQELRFKMSQTERLVFLGFAFHKNNVELIKPLSTQESKDVRVECFATGYKVSSSDCKVITKHLTDIFDRDINVNIYDGKCSSLFDEYRRSLSF